VPKNRTPYILVAIVFAIASVLAFLTGSLTAGVVALTLAVIITAYGDTHRSGEGFPR
jgi:hypothetical protein